METVEELYESAKFSGKRRGVRWGVKTSNTVRNHREFEYAHTKREHNTFLLMKREEEIKANGDIVKTGYRELQDNGWADGWEHARRRPITDNDSQIGNVNYRTPSSVVHYSVDKKKNWETIEAAKKAHERRLALTRSYSDTDELSQSSSSSEADDDYDDDASLPKVAVVERETVINDRMRRTDLGNLLLADAFVAKKTQNYSLDQKEKEDGEESPDGRYVVAKGRKGRVVRDKRPKGKRGVIKPRMANHHSRFVQDLATSDTLIAIATPMDRSHHANHTKFIEYNCCKICNPPKPNAHKRDNSSFKKKLLDQL